ncbi:exodeoxyribonuclease VII small subunit [Acinetobacter larvae]|uniref:Exodeoxyribonuclease VII n=1 Tax=Acinetobacter larvae TaxID=1789224 RepID=A0A1B2LXC2_9GAMM|nr:exodeoxyribonuclease VII small subunit [Acinetobacter larvae]AOA57591.1 exodeoxyribonuclease VII [Acinetobacter larvae]
MTDELSFKEAYTILKRNAELLETQEQPDIDQLITVVEESMRAYKSCKHRIDAVQIALEQSFQDDDDAEK